MEVRDRRGQNELRETAMWTGTERRRANGQESAWMDGRETGRGWRAKRVGDGGVDWRRGWEKTTREKEVNGNEKKRERTRDRRRATVVVFGLAGTTIQKTLVERTPGVARHRRSGVGTRRRGRRRRRRAPPVVVAVG